MLAKRGALYKFRRDRSFIVDDMYRRDNKCITVLFPQHFRCAIPFEPFLLSLIRISDENISSMLKSQILKHDQFTSALSTWWK